MTFFRFLHLVWLEFRIICGAPMPVRRPRGDIRNYARAFYICYNLNRASQDDDALGWMVRQSRSK